MSAEAGPSSTPIPVIACVSRVVTRVIDRITGDRVDYPLMVAAGVVEALKGFGIKSQIMYGPAAWIEVLEDHSPVWAGCWGKNFSFWAATEHGEVVDLNVSVAHRKRAHDDPTIKPMISPPILWAAEVPNFYRYQPEGVAELELTEKKDIERFEAVLAEVRTKCVPAMIEGKEPEFPTEPILCPQRKILDDPNQTFKKFDRALSVMGIPEAPF